MLQSLIILCSGYPALCFVKCTSQLRSIHTLYSTKQLIKQIDSNKQIRYNNYLNFHNFTIMISSNTTVTKLYFYTAFSISTQTIKGYPKTATFRLTNKTVVVFLTPLPQLSARGGGALYTLEVVEATYYSQAMEFLKSAFRNIFSVNLIHYRDLNRIHLGLHMYML